MTNSLNNKNQLPTQVGLGLRPYHYDFIEKEKPDIPWFEVLSDNYLRQSGLDFYHLEKICEAYPITLHGVGMSLGSTDPLNHHYLRQLKSLAQHTKSLMISDHLCWTSFNGQYFHELLPLPYTDEAVFHLVNRIRQVQDFLGQQIMVENVSTYLQFTHSTLKEWEFIKAIADEADCLILLDINNIYVSAHNNKFKPQEYLSKLPAARIAQLHLAGFSDLGTHLLDTHSAPVHPPVWTLFVETVKLFGAIPTIIEWDNKIPDFLRLQEEAKTAKKLMDTYAKSV